jgi:hypothetical protein
MEIVVLRTLFRIVHSSVSPSLTVTSVRFSSNTLSLMKKRVLVGAYRERKSAPMCNRSRPHDIDVDRLVHVLPPDPCFGRAKSHKASSCNADQNVPFSPWLWLISPKSGFLEKRSKRRLQPLPARHKAKAGAFAYVFCAICWGLASPSRPIRSSLHAELQSDSVPLDQ